MSEPLSAVEEASRGLELVSGRWTMLVVFEPSTGPKPFRRRSNTR